MDTDLDHWQMRLAQHFSELRDRRSTDGSGRPVFGLEHGLSRDAVDSLTTAVRRHLDSRPPSRQHWLVWIVYSSEFGYRYAGDEYWQTFEHATPGWILKGSRYWIRECFRRFQREYRGAVPTGAWASHFTIICWPITHAILPKDLQRQFAQILYELRHSFSGELLTSPSMLGELIAAGGWNASSRFRNLAQETQLVGQIAGALLLEGEFESGDLIHTATLRRISEDLDRERRTRDWLRGARRFARERAQVRGLRLPAKNITADDVRDTGAARAEIRALGIEPRLVLRPMDAERLSWVVSIEVPDLSHLLVRFPHTRDVLTGSRCTVAGATGRPLARGRFLHGRQRVKLARWPQSGDVLLQFETRDPQLEYLLRTECLLGAGPTWLFKVASDGLAYELKSQRVRAGARYVVVTAEPPLPESHGLCPIELHCDAAQGALLDVPATFDPPWEQTLRRLRLAQAKTVEVWPAGLDAFDWDGEGHGEWLASEQPCLAVRVDHPVETLSVSMGFTSGSSLELCSIEPGDPVFVALPDLPLGLHRLCFSARTTPLAALEPLGDFDVTIRIRDARSWARAITSHGPFDVQIDPPTPSLEQLWEGQIQVTIAGPAGRNVTCAVSLYEADGASAVFSKRLPPIKLPLSVDGWRNHFNTHFRNAHRVEEAYDVARNCQLVFSAGELGALTFGFSREFTPLRWSSRRHAQRFVVRLLNDSGYDSDPTVTRLAFETPIVEEPVDIAPEYPAPPSGGMYVARLPQATSAIIVPPVNVSLDALSCNPRIALPTGSVDSIVHLLATGELWGRARLRGALFAALRQRDVLLAIASHTSRLICGANWARSEVAARESNDGILLLKVAVSRGHDPLGMLVARDYVGLSSASCDDRAERIAVILTEFHLLPSQTPESEARWLSELALRVASDPAGVHNWAGERLRTGLTHLRELPALPRAARFLVLAVDAQLRSDSRADEVYPGWDWT